MRLRERMIRRPWPTATGLIPLALLTVLGGWQLVARRSVSRANINDLSASAEQILIECPAVVKVESLVTASEPTHRIIHITDCHAASREQLGEVEGMTPKATLPDDVLKRLYQGHADDVELFQESQTELLKWLVDYHGLREVFHEGVSDDDMPDVMRRIALLRDIAPWRDRLRSERLALPLETRTGDVGGRDSSALRRRRRKLELFRDYVLNFGAIGNLVVERPFVQVLPAEDAKAFAEALPKKHGGRIHGPYFDAREAAIVRNLLTHGPCAVIVLGSAHDLSREVRKQAGGRCEYFRVTVQDFPPNLVEHIKAARESSAGALLDDSSAKNGLMLEIAALLVVAIAIGAPLAVLSWLAPRQAAKNNASRCSSAPQDFRLRA